MLGRTLRLKASKAAVPVSSLWEATGNVVYESATGTRGLVEAAPVSSEHQEPKKDVVLTPWVPEWQFRAFEFEENGPPGEPKPRSRRITPSVRPRGTFPPPAPEDRKMGPRSMLEHLMDMPVRDYLSGTKFRSNRALYTEPHALSGARLGWALDEPNATYIVTHYEKDMAILQYAQGVLTKYPDLSVQYGLDTLTQSYEDHVFSPEISDLYMKSKVYLADGGEFEMGPGTLDVVKSLDAMGVEVETLAHQVQVSGEGSTESSTDVPSSSGTAPGTLSSQPVMIIVEHGYYPTPYSYSPNVILGPGFQSSYGPFTYSYAPVGPGSPLTDLDVSEDGWEIKEAAGGLALLAMVGIAGWTIS